MFKHRVQGFVAGAAVAAALMLAPQMLSTSGGHDDMDAFAASLGIEIVWTDINPCDVIQQGAEGCFSSSTPNLIYVTPSENQYLTQYAALHELGHALQHRFGVDRNECGASMIAQGLGAVSASSIGLKDPCSRDWKWRVYFSQVIDAAPPTE